VIPKELDKMDAVKYAKEYCCIGERLAGLVDEKPFRVSTPS
jgi:hypothetical protein